MTFHPNNNLTQSETPPLPGGVSNSAYEFLIANIFKLRVCARR
jgi:hypothetical protein